MDEELKKEFIKYANKLNDKYNRSTSKSKLNNYGIDFLCYANLINDIPDFEYDINWDLRTLNNIFYNNAKILISNILDKQEEYSNIANSSLEIFKKTNYNLYEGYYDNYCSINRNNMDDLILSFFNDFDSDYCNTVKKSINNSELLIAPIENYRGFIVNIDSLKKRFVVVSKKAEQNLLGLSTIIHEYGHYYEINMLHNSSVTNFSTKSRQTPFYEFSSSFFEYAFFRYLKENKLYSNGVDLVLHDYYNAVLYFLYGIGIIGNIDDINMNKDFEIDIDGYKAIDYGKKKQEELNYYELPLEGDYINFIDSYIYGLGNLAAIYMYDCYKEDKDYFKKEFNKTLFTYPYTNSIDTFNKIGVSYEELIKGDKLERVLRRNK